MAEFDIKLMNNEIITARKGGWFYFVGERPIGVINSYRLVCGRIGEIKKGGFHITTNYDDIDSAIRFIPGNKILEIRKVIIEGI